MSRALLTAALVASCAIGVAPALATGPATGTQILSNEVSLTRWAHAELKAPVYAEAVATGRPIARLHYMTEDLQPEVYLLLTQKTDASGTTWVKIRIPMRPNGRTGWVPAEALGTFHSVRTRLIVDEKRLRATLYRDGRRVWTSIVGIGAPGTPTPKGHFYVREKLTGYAGPFYGPVALGTSDYSTLSEWPKGGVVGIHGTDEPSILPGRVSHGCVRVPNAAVLRLARIMPVGTPILIR
jgi:lipoprotein-anchoring transpeptidase ErfK/SrfK